MDVRLIALFLFIMSSCMPSASVSRGKISDDDSTSTTSGSGSGNDTATVSQTGWTYLSTNSLSISIDAANLNTAYLTGSNVSTYLSAAENFTDVTYCVASNFDIGGVTYELRAKAIPVSYYDVAQKKTLKIFRVDFPESASSASVCSGTLYIQNSNGDYITDTSGALSPVFNSGDLCPSCTSILNSQRVRVFKKESTLKEIPSSLINFKSLKLSVDSNNGSSANTGTCSSSSCVARGYDCCLDNQCVFDGGKRPSASQYATLLATAEEERLQNPLAYLSYPQLYYICGSTPSTTSGSTTGSSDPSYDESFATLKKDYACIKNIKAQSTLVPFHKELLSRTTWLAATDCVTGSSASDLANPQYYRTVMTRLYNTCGCTQGSTLNEKINACPAYEYEIIKGTEANPLQIDCYTPPAEGTTPLPTQITVSVSGRTAPHRFFDSTGVERKFPLTGSTTTQEGSPFSYEDSEKVFPKQSNFSMNAILGQMSVALDKAQPAKAIDIGLDEVYFIQTTEGSYTPCPDCDADQWFKPFSAFRTTNYGTGLQASGFSTSRDLYDQNLPGGNYEDTIFGRACWIPPTMIPYSHRSMTPESSQRENRLTTQAALFNNGYQRDWFGFNKGALIGSFDGVSWFAIGKGRIVRSTTKKLFLAINAPFADVASASSYSVNVLAYDGTTQAAQVDYDPTYHQTHAYQNEAGNCQAQHMCQTDTDCITRLGWEYSCADVSQTKTNWPKFDSSSKEMALDGVLPAPTIVDVLEQKRFPTSETKRCVYRGGGSLCLKNAATVTDLNKKKTLTCAPNFYCAALASGAVFNGKVARFANKLQNIPVARNHLIGRDANVLGRPLNYLSGSESVSLPSDVASTLIANMALSLPGQESLATTANTGLCLPGKALPTTLADQATMANPFNQHLNPDPSKRTDFIAQIGSCNSTLFTTYRHSSCPVLGTDGNYQMFAATTIPDTLAYSKQASNQNACGMETLLNGSSLVGTADTIAGNSPFRSIEAKVLPNQVIEEKTFARDACLRRAGSVCHTDLDCSPNKFHSEEEDIYSLSYFGNQAEKDYYDQYLVCGQTDAKPAVTDANFKTYNMALNRCCREVGSDISTYTPDIPTSVVENLYDATSKGLKMSLAPGTAPNDSKRYSRFATVENIGTTERPLLSAYHDRNNATGDLEVSATSVNVKTAKQWKTLNEANSETCCGGGWIRKFANGQKWGDRKLVDLDVTNFSCLNSRTPLLTTPGDLFDTYGANPSPLVDADYGDYCKDSTGTKGSCAQYSFRDSLTDTLPIDDPYAANVAINTLSPVFASSNKDHFFSPRSADGDPAIFIDFANTAGRRDIKIKIPSYVSTEEFDGVVSTTVGTSPYITGILSSGVNIGACTNTSSLGPTCGSTCCYELNTSNRVLKVVLGSTYPSLKAGVILNVKNAASYITPALKRSQPGTNSFYLRRLGRLELSGVPQITYEGLYCNDNSDRILPGIFRANVKTKADFDSVNFSFKSGGVNYTSSQGLVTEQVFAANDFKCCSPLGKSVTDSTKCCSGYATTSGSSKTCALPSGTDLMVYFNRFISNEGVGTDKPGGGLLETEFDQSTGEPLLTTAINRKISDLGIAYCATKKVRQGGAFGSFEPQPAGNDTNLSSRIYGIVDSSNDNGVASGAGTTLSTGYTMFKEFGFRWNHHLYCED